MTKASKYQTSYAEVLEHERETKLGMQHSNHLITKAELKELIEREKIRPEQIFSKQDFLNDEKLMKAINDEIELEQYRELDRELNKQMDEEIDADKLKENDMIPGDEPQKKGEKKKPNPDNEFIPGNDKPGDDQDLIPD